MLSVGYWVLILHFSGLPGPPKIVILSAAKDLASTTEEPKSRMTLPGSIFSSFEVRCWMFNVRCSDFSPFSALAVQFSSSRTRPKIDLVVTWKGNPDLTPLIGKPVYLRFELQNMGLIPAMKTAYPQTGETQ